MVQVRHRSFSFRPEQVLTSLIAGMVISITEITLSLAFASLIFSGDLSGYVPQAIGLMLVAQMIILMTTTLLTSLPGIIAGVQDVSAAVLAITAVTIVKQMPADNSSGATYWTVMAVLSLTAFSTGAVLWLLGRFQLGNLVRFIPYPVIGGFLGGTGLLLVRGGISVLSNTSLALGNLTSLLESDMLVKWLPGLVVAVILLVLVNRYSSPFVIPSVVLGTLVIFYAALFISGSSVSEASDNGWMLIVQSEKGTWEPWTLDGIENVEWGVVVKQASSMGVIAALSAVSLLLNATGLELLFRQDIDLNRELKTAGIANLLVGFVGGAVGFQSLSVSLLSDKLGVRGRRAPALIVGTFCILLLFFGGGLLAYIPNLLLGGLIVFLGLALVIEWVYDAWFKFSHIEYMMILSILLIMNGLGFLEGVAIGLLLSTILFAYNYSQTPVVKLVLTGRTYHSNVVRSNLCQGLLRSKGDWLYILKLHGYLFFGTANKLLNQFQTRLADTDNPAPHFVVFDFQLVTGLDSSAELSFIRIKQIAEAHEIVLVFTKLSPAVQRQLERDVLQGDGYQVFPDLDRGVEWCENQLLDIFAEVGLVGRPKTLVQQFRDALGTSDIYEELMQYFERRKIEAGHILIRQGEVSQQLYFIERGHVTVQLEVSPGSVIRLRRMEAGTIVGETSFYLNRMTTASVIADQPCTVYSLTTDALRRMEAEKPGIAAVFHREMVCLLADRLGNTTETLQALVN